MQTEARHAPSVDGSPHQAHGNAPVRGAEHFREANADLALECTVRGEQRERPTVSPITHDLAELGVEIPQCGRLAYPYPVWGVRDDAAGSGRKLERGDRALTELDVASNSSALRVRACCGDGTRIAIRRDDRRWRRRANGGNRLVDSFAPRAIVEPAPAHERERPASLPDVIDSRRHPARDHRALDRDRPGAAHRIRERRSGIPPRADEHRGGQRFPQRSLHHRLPIPATMQQPARAVRTDRHLVVDETHDEQLCVVAARRLFSTGTLIRTGHREPARKSVALLDSLREALRHRIGMVETRLPAGDTEAHPRGHTDVPIPGDALRTTFKLVELPRVQPGDAEY